MSRRHRFPVVRPLAVLLGAAVWLSATAMGDVRTAERLAAELPRAFAGCFFWRGDETGQEIRYAFENVVPDGGRVVASGEGINVAGENVHQVHIRALIDPRDLTLEIRESDPERISGGAGYVTDGAFRGRLSDDLRRVSATWTTNRSGEKGDLILTAADGAFSAFGGRAGLHCEAVSS